jgi:hypothetical protein
LSGKIMELALIVTFIASSAAMVVKEIKANK